MPHVSSSYVIYKGNAASLNTALQEGKQMDRTFIPEWQRHLKRSV